MHGYNSSKESFYYQIVALARHFRVTALDILGFGESDGLIFPWGIEEYADFIKSFLTKLKIKKPHIIAHSFGGRLAVFLASESQNYFDRIVLTASAGINIKRGIKYKCKVASYKIVKKFFPVFAEKHFGSTEYRKLSPLQKESYKKIVNYDLTEKAKLITNKTLLIYGDKDLETPLKIAKIYNNSIANSQLFIFNNAGHFPFIDDWHKFNCIVEEFLNT